MESVTLCLVLAADTDTKWVTTTIGSSCWEGAGLTSATSSKRSVGAERLKVTQC